MEWEYIKTVFAAEGHLPLWAQGELNISVAHFPTMQHICLRAKITNMTVTEARVEYEGSITIDGRLLDAAGILEYEKVQVLSFSTGTRLETYTIRGKEGSGIVCMNGPSALLIKKGDSVMVHAYGLFTPAEAAKRRKPTIVTAGTGNVVKGRKEGSH